MSEHLLELNKVRKFFPVKKGKDGNMIYVKAVDQIDLNIDKGDIVGLVGESGCGKSTLGKCIVRLHDVTEGEVIFDGEDIAKLSEKTMRPYRKRIQIIFQDPYGSLNPKKTVMGSLMTALDMDKSLTKEQETEKMIGILNEVGLDEKYLTKYPHEMSGGQRQRVVIARALINDPDLVVCDEPVSALDVSVRSQVLNLLKDLQAQRGLTYIFISHDLSVVEYLCDKIAVMYLGKIMEYADKESLFKEPLHPYTKALLSAIPVPDIHHEKQEIILEGEVPSPLDPPKGCLFSTRCPHASDRCRSECPELIKKQEDGKERQVACFLYE